MKYLIIILILFSMTLKADLVIIASKTCKIKELSMYDVKSLFMIKKKSINNEKIIVLDSENLKLYETFVDKYLKKSQRQMKVYWVRMLFTGKKVAPKRFLIENFSSLETNKNCYLTYIEEENLPKEWQIIKIK